MFFCGQHSDVRRIQPNFIFKDLSLGLFNIDSGFLYTAKALFLRPGYAIRDYINDKRVRYFMPISMLIVLSTINSFLYHILKIDLFQVDIVKQNTDPKIARFYNIIDGNYVYLTLGSLPLLTLSSCLFFKKAKLNFAEHLILNTSAACQRLIIHLVFLTVLVSIS